MFPVSDVIPSRTSPVVTLALIFLISGAFIYQVQLDETGLGTLFDTYAITPRAITATRLVAALFLHAGWLHAVVNVLYLWLFGPNVEEAFGRRRFVLFYVTTGALSATVQTLVPVPVDGPVIGASGAVAGILGAYLVLYPQSRLLTVFFAVFYLDLIEIPAMAFVGAWFVLQLATDIGTLGLPVIAGPAAFWAHVAGFAIGLTCGAYARWHAGVLRKYWVRNGSR
jgi:membrane associated rhomboid family serine protease